MREHRFHGVKSASARELVDNGVVGVVIMRETRVVFACVVEDLEGELEILLACDHGNKAFRVEVYWPVFERGRDRVRL